jgi:class 3 adenylate cyclase
MPLDKEIKFISSANTQIKFYNQNLHAEIFKKIERLLVTLGIEIKQKIGSSSEKSATRLDRYFDDDWRLADQGCSLSARFYHSKSKDPDARGPDMLIFKDNEQRGFTNGIEFLTRRELKSPIDEAERAAFMRDGIPVAELKRYFPDADFAAEDDTVFRLEGETHIRRSSYIIAVGDKPYRLSVDRYYFFNCELNKFSETYTEIEIEHRADGGDFDPKVKQLSDVLRTMFEIEVEPISKYHRFKEFSVSDDFREFYFVGFDLVAYSAGPSWTQKQIVQRFHKIIKDQVTRTGFPKDDQPIKISIGDGAVVAARVDWTNIVRLLRRIATAVKKNNAADPLRTIEYRAAVHYGPVFRFTDLNDMINVAGQGINIVNRILAEVGGGQVVLSRDAYNRAIDASAATAEQFRELGERRVKHGVVVQLYQYLEP